MQSPETMRCQCCCSFVSSTPPLGSSVDIFFYMMVPPEQWPNPWLLRVYPGLYYPVVIWEWIGNNTRAIRQVLGYECMSYSKGLLRTHINKPVRWDVTWCHNGLNAVHRCSPCNIPRHSCILFKKAWTRVIQSNPDKFKSKGSHS